MNRRDLLACGLQIVVVLSLITARVCVLDYTTRPAIDEESTQQEMFERIDLRIGVCVHLLFMLVAMKCLEGLERNEHRNP